MPGPSLKLTPAVVYIVTGVTSLSAAFGSSAFDEEAENCEEAAEVFDDAAEDEFEAADEAADEASAPEDEALPEPSDDEASLRTASEEAEALTEEADFELPFPTAPQPVKVSVKAAARERNSVRTFFRFDIFSPLKRTVHFAYISLTTRV